MVFMCCVPNCRLNNKNVQMHMFPKDENLFSLWLNQIGRSDLGLQPREKIRKNFRVCDVHFGNEESYVGSRYRSRIKKNAVPTLKLPEVFQNAPTENKPNNRLEIIEEEELDAFLTVKCRTCLNTIQVDECSDIGKEIDGETLKDMLGLCVPQMVKNINDGDFICKKCVKYIYHCSTFIKNCIDVEKKLQKCTSNTSNINDVKSLKNSSKECRDYNSERLNFINKDNLESTTEVKQLQELNTSCQCNICDQKFPNYKSCLLHKYTHGFPCNLCDEVPGSRDELVLHTSEYHTSRYICHKCGKSFFKLSNLQFHIAVHYKTNNRKLKRYTCNQCPMQFRFLTGLQEHKNTAHFRIKAYRCEGCGSKFATKSNLRYHFSIAHESSSLFACDVCGINFIHSNYLEKHKLRKHAVLNSKLEYETDNEGTQSVNMNKSPEEKKFILNVK